jgi:energy-coupling factor transporter ATP-binding protein EcfA2
MTKKKTPAIAPNSAQTSAYGTGLPKDLISEQERLNGAVNAAVDATKPILSKEAEVPEGSHIVELFVENVMKVKVAHIKPKGNVIQITGKNGAGKTSVLRAIAWALTGTSDVPSQPIRAGQRVGMVKMDLGDLVVTRYFTRVDPDKSKEGNTYITKLLVEGKKREMFRSPQLVLNALMGQISFDPLAFTRMDDKKQLETLRGLVTFDLDIDALDAKQKEEYDARREAGREVDSRKARLEAMQAPREGLPAAQVDVEGITKRLEGAANHNSVVAAHRARKQRLLDEADSLVTLNEAHLAEIERLKLRIDELKGKIKANLATADICRGDSRSIEPLEEIDTAAVAAELSQANAINREIAQAEMYLTVEEELRQANEYWERLDKSIKDRSADRVEAIARAKMPIEGLSIGDGEVLYGGLPFGQASNAEQIRVSMALAMASNPKLRVLRISDGSLLDTDSMQLVTDAAGKHGFQVWIERVDASGAVGVVMEDGEASGEDVVSDGKA